MSFSETLCPECGAILSHEPPLPAEVSDIDITGDCCPWGEYEVPRIAEETFEAAKSRGCDKARSRSMDTKTTLVVLVALSVVLTSVMVVIPKNYDGYIGHNDWTVAWDYDGEDYELSYHVPQQEYTYYSDSSVSRHAGDQPSSITGFVVTEGVVAAIAEKLSDLFEERYSGAYAAEERDFYLADFILAFVQLGFKYDDDDRIYGAKAEKPPGGLKGDYWAYPAETLYFGDGDCEDTSILCASIMKARGLASALIYFNSPVDGHVMTGVRLAGVYPFEAVDPLVYNRSAILVDPGGDERYYACETTVDTYLSMGQRPNGTVSGSYTPDTCGDVRVYDC